MARKHRRSRKKAEAGIQGETLLEKIGGELELPRSAVSNTCHIELSGNREAIVDGCKGVLEYDENTIKLNTGKTIVRFTGTDLSINTLNMETAVIEGNIVTLDFSS